MLVSLVLVVQLTVHCSAETADYYRSEHFLDLNVLLRCYFNKYFGLEEGGEEHLEEREGFVRSRVEEHRGGGEEEPSQACVRCTQSETDFFEEKNKRKKTIIGII